MSVNAIHNPDTSKSYFIPGGMFPGRIITVKGYMPYGADRSAVDFQYNSDIAFHFNPRLSENFIVRNHFISGEWGNEENSGGMPLTKGETFVIHFICHYDRFKVMIDGKHFCDFYHRVPFHRITYIAIRGFTPHLIDFEGVPPPLEYIPGSSGAEKICCTY